MDQPTFQVDGVLERPRHVMVAKRHPATPSKAESPIGERVRLFLKNNTFLGCLPDTALDALLRRGHIKKYSTGDVICRRQEAGDTLMVVVAGRIKITNSDADGKEIVLNFLGAGDIIGEIAVLDGKERTADAIALQGTELFLVYARDLMPTLTAHPQALLELIQILCERLRAASAVIEDNALDMRRRAARGLLRLALQLGRNSKDGIRVDLVASQSELGSYLGLSRQSVNRQLGLLRDAKVIRNDGAHIIVTDELALCEIAEATSAKH